MNNTHKYWSDATGRDSYIVGNNGGFFSKTPCKQAYKNFSINNNRLMSAPKQHYIEKQVHYYNDGTGKDTYIK